jgi:plastocyanin
MIRGILTLAFATVVAVAVLTGPVAAKDSGGLKGEVYPNFKIEMKLGGKDLKTLKAGTYTMKVEDKAKIHNFHLMGPGVNKATSVAGVGETTWTVKFKKGRYTYVCDPHASTMKGSFTVK